MSTVDTNRAKAVFAKDRTFLAVCMESPTICEGLFELLDGFRDEAAGMMDTPECKPKTWRETPEWSQSRIAMVDGIKDAITDAKERFLKEIEL